MMALRAVGAAAAAVAVAGGAAAALGDSAVVGQQPGARSARTDLRVA